MAELVVGELLHGTNALLVEELHIVAACTVEEVVGTDAKPEEMNFLVGIVGIVVDIRNIR